MEIIGTIKAIDETKAFGANGFRKRELVITTDEQYPQHIMVEFTQDRCDILNNYRAGDMVSVGINLRGREWVNPQGETKYFNSIQGWRIEKKDGQATQSGSAVEAYQQRPQSAGDQFMNLPPSGTEEHDDLPF